jgi:hypothetical protein
MTSNKIIKISKSVNYFSYQVKLAASKVEEVFRLLNAHRSGSMFSELMDGLPQGDYSTLGIKASELSEKEIAELMGNINETGNENIVKVQTEALIEAIEDAVEQGKVNSSAANNAVFFLNKEKNKALTPTNFLNELDQKSKPISQQSPNPSSNQTPAQLAQKYYDALEDFEAFVTANANGFNPNLRSKLSSKMEQFQNALSSYEANKKEMTIQTAQQWAAPILLVIASLIATGNKNNSTQANNLWMQITKASNGQVAQGFSAGTWLTMRNNPYHQATQKDVADLAALGIKVEVGEFILPVDQIKKNPTNEQKAQMDAKKSVDRLKGEVKSISDKARQFF